MQNLNSEAMPKTHLSEKLQVDKTKKHIIIAADVHEVYQKLL